MVGIDAAQPASLGTCLEDSDVAVVVTPLDTTRGFERDSELSVNMIKAAVDAGAKRVIYVGSWTVKNPKELRGIAQRFVATERSVRRGLGLEHRLHPQPPCLALA